MRKTLETILERRTIHAYTREPLPSEIIRRGIECATHAPNHRLTYPWRFFRLGPKSRAQVAELQVELKGLDGAAANAMREKMIHEGELLVVSIVRSTDDELEREDYASLACAIQNMALYFWSEGYGTKWSTGAVTRHEKIYELLAIENGHFNPETLRLCGFFWIGKPSGKPPSAPHRPAIDEVFWDLP